MKTTNLHKEKGSAEYINRLNKIRVLNLIRQKEAISRADIVKQTGLSAPTITRIVDSLINREGLALEIGMGESNGGRPPLLVRFNGENNYVVGLDWGRTHIYIVIADLNARTVFELDEPITVVNHFDQDLKSVVERINRMISDSGIPCSKILGMGVAAAGYINSTSGEIEFSPNFGWSRVNLERELGACFLFPVKVDNVSRVMALGELWYGLGRQIDHFMYVNIGYGIGAGIIVDRKPMTGFDGFSGEIGHTRLMTGYPSGENRSCACGKTDCLECYASGRGIAETARRSFQPEKSKAVNELCEGNPEKITSELLARAANSDDRFALDIFFEAANLLGLALANFSNAINPQAVIVGGKVTLAGDFFVKTLSRVFKEETLQQVSRPVELHCSSFPGKEAVRGAVALVLKDVLELNLIV